MRRFLLGLAIAILCVLTTTATTGCGPEFVQKNARSSLAGFLTGVFSNAVDAAVTPD